MSKARDLADGTFDTDLTVSGANPNIDVSDAGTSHASQDFLSNSSAVRATIGVEQSAGGGLFVGSSGYAAVFGTASAGNTQFASNNNVRMTLDTSGNLLVGKTAEDLDTNGFEARAGGTTIATVTNSPPLYVNRRSSDGTIIDIRRDGTVRGLLGNSSTALYITNGTSTGIKFGTNAFYATDGTGANVDNAKDVGTSGVRFDDVYATSGVVNTSDATEKQSIASLTDAEITAAKTISKLFKTYKWNSSVEAKGDAARTHTGVIAQEVEQAMTDAGLDVGNYGFFIRGVWHEDADGNEVEADTEGAVERTRLGIRYPELLSFIGAATEQRLTSIEARLDALETP